MKATRCWDLCVFNIICKLINSLSWRAKTWTHRTELYKHTTQLMKLLTRALTSPEISSTHIVSLLDSEAAVCSPAVCRCLSDRWSVLRVYIDRWHPQHRKWPHTVRLQRKRLRRVWRASPPPPRAPIIMQLCFSCFHQVIYNGCIKLLINSQVGVLTELKGTWDWILVPFLWVVNLLRKAVRCESAKNRRKVLVWELKTDVERRSLNNKATGVHNKLSS